MLKPSFKDFCKGFINDKYRLIACGQLYNNKSLMAHSKKNPNRSFKIILNHIIKDEPLTLLMIMLLAWCLIKRCILLESILEKTNHPENICFKQRHELGKGKNKSSGEQ